MPFLQRQRWFGGKARRVRSARFIDWGVLRRGAAAAVRHHRRRQLRGWRAGQLFPAAGDLRGRRSARRRGAFSKRGAGAGDRRAQGRALRRVARQRLRPRAARDVRLPAGRPLAARHAARRWRPAASRVLRGDGPLDVGRLVRRAEQHVPRLRQSTDPQAVQTPAARHQPRLRDRPSADRARRLSASTDGCRCPGIPDGRGATDDRRDAATVGREPGRRLAARDRRSEPLLRGRRGNRSAGRCPARLVHCRDRRACATGDRRCDGWVCRRLRKRSDAERRKCTSRWPATPAIPRSARSHSRPRISPAFAAARLRRRARRSTP